MSQTEEVTINRKQKKSTKKANIAMSEQDVKETEVATDESKEEVEIKTESEQTYSKSAFLNAAKGSKDRLILSVLLEDDKSYTKAEVEKVVHEWKSKEAKE